MNILHKQQITIASALLLAILTGCSLWPVEKRLLSDNAYIRKNALVSVRRLEGDKRDAVIRSMISTLAAGDDRRSSRAVRALVSIGEPSARPVAAALSESDPYVRTMAVVTLGDIATPVDVVLPGLLSALKDPHPLVREEAVHALGRLGSTAKDAAPALLSSLNDADPGVRDAAQMTLKRLGVTDSVSTKIPKKPA